MKKLMITMIAAFIFCFTATTAMADFFLGIEVPFAYNFKEADDGSSLEADGMPSGFIFLAQLPFFSGGVGLESYDIKLDMSGDHSISMLMADAFYVLPIPVVNVALGAGYGTVEVKGDNAEYYEQSNCSQYFLRLGVPISPMFELIGSYHNVFAKVKVKDSDRKLEAGGTMTTVGFAVGF